LIFDAQSSILPAKDLPDRMNSHHPLFGIILLAAVLAALGLRYATRKKAPVPAWGLWGLAIILLAEALLFLRVPWVPIYFTPIVWTGYLLLADSLVYSLEGSSLISVSLLGFLLLAFWSIPLWLIFEAYNLRLRNWTYVGLPASRFLSGLGYVWSFATIWPAIFETADLLSALGWRRRGVLPPFAKDGPGVVERQATTSLDRLGEGEKKLAYCHPEPIRCAQGELREGSLHFCQAKLLMPFFLGLACLTIPVLVPPRLGGYLFGLVWAGFVLLLDPINYSWGGRSFLRDLERGDTGRLYAFLSSGLFCGILWEFWNYWADAKWLYIFPIWQNWKVFEMPAPGFLGFPPFAVECAVMVEFLRLLYGKVRRV
jgi:hypothetical protein